MLENHDLLGSSMKCLDTTLCIENSGAGFFTVFICKHSPGDDDFSIELSLKSSIKKTRRSEESVINKEQAFKNMVRHSLNLLNWLHSKRKRFELIFHEMAKNFVICLALIDVTRDANVARVISTQVEKIGKEFNDCMAKIRLDRLNFKASQSFSGLILVIGKYGKYISMHSLT